MSCDECHRLTYLLVCLSVCNATASLDRKFSARNAKCSVSRAKKADTNIRLQRRAIAKLPFLPALVLQTSTENDVSGLLDVLLPCMVQHVAEGESNGADLREIVSSVAIGGQVAAVAQAAIEECTRVSQNHVLFICVFGEYDLCFCCCLGCC